MAITVDTVETLETLPESVNWLENDAPPATVTEFEAGFIYASTPLSPISGIAQNIFNALGNLGFTGHINDRLQQYYLANGATSPNINDAERQFLIAQGATPGHIQDMWFEVLGNAGFTGSLNDRLNDFWADGGSFGPAVPNLLIIPMGLSIESWDMTSQPYVSAGNPLATSPGEGINACDYSPSLNILAVVGQNLHLYDCSTFPFTFIQTIALDAVDKAVVRFSPDGRALATCAGTPTVSNFYLFDTDDWSNVVVRASVTCDSIDFSNNGTLLFFSKSNAGTPGIGVYDINTLASPSVIGTFAGDTAAYTGITYNDTLDMMMGGNNNNDDIYQWDVSAVSFTRQFDTSHGDHAQLKFTLDNLLFITLSTGADGLRVFNSVGSDSSVWTQRSFNAGDEFPTGSDQVGEINFDLSQDGLYLFVSQNRLTTEDSRIVYDLTTNPIERVISFDPGDDPSFIGRSCFVLPAA